VGLMGFFRVHRVQTPLIPGHGPIDPRPGRCLWAIKLHDNTGPCFNKESGGILRNREGRGASKEFGYRSKLP
jgi:hypothetical protein